MGVGVWGVKKKTKKKYKSYKTLKKTIKQKKKKKIEKQKIQKQSNQKEETYMVSFFLCYRFVSSTYTRHGGWRCRNLIGL